MSDTLLGVIIGGVLASITPLITLFINHAHWKQESKLNHLKFERQRLATLFEKTLAKLDEAMSKNIYPSDMISDIAMFMPNDVFKTFDEFLLQGNHSEQQCKQAYLEIAMAMKKALADIDKNINSLLS